MRSRPTISRTALAILTVLMLVLSAVSQAEYRKPKPQQTAKVSLGQGLTGADLERIKVGNQAGVLKVTAPDTTVKFIKASRGQGGEGIDGREYAPLSPVQRDQILVALGITNPNTLAGSLMSSYTRLSRAHALALLGVLAYPGQTTPSLEPAVQTKVIAFLRSRLQPAEDNIVRRQAVVALAIQPNTEFQTVAAMMNFLRRDHNAWNTFGVVQYFEYQRDTIQKLPQFAAILTQVKASGSPHTDQILRDLKTPAPAAPAPPVAPVPPVAPPAVPPADPSPQN